MLQLLPLPRSAGARRQTAGARLQTAGRACKPRGAQYSTAVILQDPATGRTSRMQTLVSLDIETTGLDPVTDAIIEIGAVRFRNSRQVDEWSQLVNPGRPLSRFITQLTGITDEMLSRAPRITEVLQSLEDFVGDVPIVGHRVEFDLSFLRRKGLFGENQPLDTYDLAAVVLPDAGRYGLGALANLLKVPLVNAHRALDDAKTTMQVFQRLYQHVLELPYPLLKVLSEMAEPIDWGAGWVFEAALDERTEAGEIAPENGRLEFPSFASQPTSDRALAPLDQPLDLDIEELTSLIEPGGELSKAIEGYEHRTQQVQMLKAVSEALTESRHLLVEAGTGSVSPRAAGRSTTTSNSCGTCNSN